MHRLAFRAAPRPAQAAPGANDAALYLVFGGARPEEPGDALPGYLELLDLVGLLLLHDGAHEGGRERALLGVALHLDGLGVGGSTGLRPHGVEEPCLLLLREVAHLDGWEHLHAPIVHKREQFGNEVGQAYEALHLVLADPKLFGKNVA